MKTLTFLIILYFTFNFATSFGQAPGSLDLSFNNLGYRIDTLGNQDDRYNKILRLPDGKFLICGQATSSYGLHPILNLYKIDSNGNLDSSFNQITSGGLFPVSYGGSEAFVMTINTNDQILVGGTNWYNSPYTSVARLNVDGNLDATFSPGGAIAGSVSTNLNSPDNLDYGTPSPSDVKTDSEGNVFICGNFNSANLNHFDGTGPRGMVVKYTNQGVLDSSFASNAFYNFDVSLIINPLSPYGDYQSSADQIEFLSDGKILVLGSFTDAEFPLLGGFLARLNSNGTLDQTFATNGILNITNCDFSSDRAPERMIIEDNGSITIIGTKYNDLLCRVLPNGVFDTSFGNNGFKPNVYLGNGSIVMFEKTDNGKYIFATNASVGRLNADLSYDYSFRLATSQSLSLPPSNTFYSGTITNTGEILMVGQVIASPQFTNSLIARINGSECTLMPIDQPTDVYGNLNSSVAISVSISNATKYTWEKKIFTSSCISAPFYWSFVSESAPYSGTTTSELTISNLTQALDSSIYRCVIQTTTCAGVSEEITLHIGEEPSSLEEIITNRITASPNPAGDYIRITSDSNHELHEFFQIIDLNGKVVQTGKLNGLSQEVNLSLLSKGMYRIQLENGGGLNFIHEN